LNRDVSILDEARAERIHPLMVFAVTFPCGEINEMKSELIFVSLRWVDVLSTYTLIASTGQHAESGRPGITIDCSGPLCCAFLGFKRVNVTPLFEKIIDDRLMEASSETLSKEARANNMAVFRVNTEIARLRFSPSADK
jgi:hypothetical protein